MKPEDLKSAEGKDDVEVLLKELYNEGKLGLQDYAAFRLGLRTVPAGKVIKAKMTYFCGLVDLCCTVDRVELKAVRLTAPKDGW